MVYDCIIPGHTHFFYHTHDISNTPCTHVSFCGLFFTHLIGLNVGSVNKTTKLFADINIPLSTIGS